MVRERPYSPVLAYPNYTELERNRLGTIRRDFSDLENSPEINRLRTEYESELLSLPRRPAEDEPLLTSLIVPPSGFFTVTLPDFTPCLLTFSTPLRAGSCFHLPPDEIHCIENSGTTVMRILGVFHPSGSPASRAYQDNK